MALSTTTRIIITTITCVALGGLSGLVTVDAIDPWYATLQKPSFNPPNVVFGPAWTILYTLMGIAVGLVWAANAPRELKRKAIGVFVAQFVLNLAWSVIFFGMRSPTIALAEIIVLLITLIACTVLFFRVRPVAGWLLVPYVLWVSFAAVLNAAIVVLNP